MGGWVDALVDGGLGGLQNAGSQAKPACFCVLDPTLGAVDKQLLHQKDPRPSLPPRPHPITTIRALPRLT